MLAGRSVLSWQIELALSLGCERIVCLCEVAGAEIIAQQRMVEADGIDFHAVRSHAQLAGLIRADDELFVLLDGLLPDQSASRELLTTQGKLVPAILTLAADHRLSKSHPEDFERIDRDRHWAGIAVMRGSRVQELADLPPDGDALSLLLRLALQSRVECRAVSLDTLDDDRWVLANNTEAIALRSSALINAGVPRPEWTGPGAALANLLARKVGPQGIANGLEWGAGTALLLFGVAAVPAGFGYGGIALAIASLGAFACAVGEAFGKLRQFLAHSGADSMIARFLPAFSALATVLILILVYDPLESAEIRVALPILATGLSWLAACDAAPPASAFWRDRTLHLAGFAISAAFGVFSEILILFALGALAQMMLRARTN